MTRISRATWILIEQGEQWRVAKWGRGIDAFQWIDVTPADKEQTVEQLVLAMEAQGYAGNPTVVALASDRCLTASIPVTDGNRKASVQSLSYELEAELPIAAEEFVSDFIHHEDQYLGIAVETAPLLEFLSELEDRGVKVISITPMAVLALQESWLSLDVSDIDIVLLQSNQQYDVFRISGDQIAEWLYGSSNDSCSESNRFLEQQIPYLEMRNGKPLRVGLVGLDAETAEKVQARPEVLHSKILQDIPTEKLAAKAVDRIGRRALIPWIELCRSPLGIYDAYREIRPQLNLVTGLAVLLLIAITGICYWKGSQLNREANVYYERRSEVYRETFPDRRVPAFGIQKQLENEWEKLSDLNQQFTSLPQSQSAFLALTSLLTSFPDQGAYRVKQIDVDQHKVTLDVEIETMDTVSRIVEDLEKGGFQVTYPSNQRMRSGKTSIRIYAIYSGPLEASQA